MSKMIIVEGNSNDKDNVRVLMVKGEKGYSAYDLYVQNGGTLTEEEWLDAFLNAENYYNKTETDNLLDEKTCIYDTVALMKADTDLKNGMVAKTLGYYGVNDGGAATYKITSTESQTYYQEELTNGLFATLIINDEILSSLVLGDTITENIDDSLLFQKVIDISSYYKIQIKMQNKNYNIGTSLKIKSNTNIDFNNAIIKLNNNVNDRLFYNLDNYDIQINKLENIKLINFNYDGNAVNNNNGSFSTTFITLCYVDNVIIDNFTITNTVKNAIYLYECSNVKITNGITTNTGNIASSPNYETAVISINNRNGYVKGSNIYIDNIKSNNYCYGIIFIYSYDYIIIKNCEIIDGLSSPYRSIPLTLTECKYIDMLNINIDGTSSVAFEINQNTKYLNVDNMKITNSGQPITFGPNTVADSINEYIKFTNCLFDKSTSSSYMMAINNAKNIIFENCYNNSLSGIASSYTLVDNIIFKNCNFKFNFSDFYLFKYWKIENSIINDIKVNKFELAYGSTFPQIDIILPYDLSSSNSVDIAIPFNFSTNYNFSGHLDVFGFFSINSYYQYFAKFLYKTSVNSSDTGSVVDLQQKIGDNYYKVTPTAVTRNKITITKTASEAIRGYIHLYL